MFRATLLVFIFASPAWAQAPSPAPSAAPSPAADVLRFPSQVDLVTVDVVVTDKKDVPISGLTKADFAVTEDGQPQQIESFEAVQAPVGAATPTGASSPAPVRPVVSTNAEPPERDSRSYVLLFDDLHLTPAQGQRAKGAVNAFLKQAVSDGDHVSLMSTGGSAWWSTRIPQGRDDLLAMVKRLDGRLIPDTSPDRVTEWEAMRIHNFRDPNVTQEVSRRFETYGASAGQSGRQQDATNPNGDPLVEARASDVYFQSLTRNRLTLMVMRRAVESLSVARGRKSVVLVSQGFIYDSNIDEFKQVLESARRSNVAIFFLDTRGLQGMPIEFSAEFGPAIDERDVHYAFAQDSQAAEGAESLALDSGGFVVKNSNDLTRGVQRIAQEAHTYYLLGYLPKNPRREGRFRKIEVKVLRKGTNVRARKGYYEPTPDGAPPPPLEVEKGADPDIQHALDSPYALGAIPMRMTAYTFDETLLGRAGVLLAADVDIRAMQFKQEGDRSVDTLEFLMIVVHRETGEHSRYDQKIEMKLSAPTRARLERDWMPIQRDFELAPGGYQAKLVVRDLNAKVVASVIHEFDVPPLAGLRTSTPLLTDALQQSVLDPKAPPRGVPMVRRAFAPESTLYVHYQVYGAQREKGTGMPRVAAGLEIVDAQGAVQREFAATPIKPTSLGKLSRIVGTPLAGLPPGDYRVVLKLTDTANGKTYERSEAFTIDATVAPSPPTAAPPAAKAP